ncbi:MAG: exodeoxyribonuclease III [Coriobacteriales bacterium]|jgi:exodeoxyribonuclease-3|nr:exodeoxyribonuclease III [Coriobacteriales bacterium]
MRLVSWNVNGLRACLKKGFLEAFAAFDADVFALQEIKLSEGQVELDLPAGYHQVWSYAQRKGYSGTAVFSKQQPLRVVHNLGLETTVLGNDARVLDTEGRLCAVELEHCWLVCCYTPNAQDGLARIELRLAWGAAFREFVAGLAADKPVVVCGDLNVAHNEIDLRHPGPNRGNAGFSDEERGDFNELLAAGFTDTFRHLYPDLTGAYSWWSYRGSARANNTGWRIDYFLVSDALVSAIEQAAIWPEVHGSDHCPVSLELRGF